MLRALFSAGLSLKHNEDREGARIYAFACALTRILWTAKKYSSRKSESVSLLITPIIRQERYNGHHANRKYSTGGIKIDGEEKWIVLEPRTEQETITAIRQHQKNIISGGIIPFTLSVSASDISNQPLSTQRLISPPGFFRIRLLHSKLACSRFIYPVHRYCFMVALLFDFGQFHLHVRR